jgi:hypothetical protein
MPKLFEWNGFRFFFFSNEGIPLEPCHIHVRKGKSIAKFWIADDVILDSSWGLSPKELSLIQSKIEEKKEFITEKWDEFFKQ